MKTALHEAPSVAGNRAGGRSPIVVSTTRPTSERVLGLVRTLGIHGHDVTLATTDDQALEQCCSVDRALIVVEWTMPDVDYGRLLTTIRRERERHQAYVIAVVAEGGAITAEAAIAAGADDFIVAPLDPAIVHARIGVAERSLRLQYEVSMNGQRLTDSTRRLEDMNARLRAQLEAAARVQQALLPAAHFRVPGYDIGWSLRPCSELAGDVLNCVRLDEHHMGLYVLDVSGHGVSAALLAVQVARLMSPLMSESNLLKKPLSEAPWYRIVCPADVVGQLNATFQMTPDLPQYFTIVYAVLHLKLGRLHITSGGHPPPVHVPAGCDPVALPTTCSGMAVGFLDSARYEETELVLAPGDRIWLYSDGIVESADRQGDMLLPEGLNRCIARSNGRQMQAAVDTVMSDVECWALPGSPGDDCSLLAVEMTDPD